MISFSFCSHFISLYEHILQFFFHDKWYCSWLHMTLLRTEMDPISFHPESIDGLPCQEFMRRFVFAIVVLLSNCDVHLLRFMFEISWQGIYLKYEEIYVYFLETFVLMCCFFLITMFATACFIWHFSSLMQLWYWGIPPSLRLSSLGYNLLLPSLGFDFLQVVILGHIPCVEVIKIFTIICIGVQSPHLHRHSEPSSA